MTQWERMLVQIREEFEEHSESFLSQKMISRTMHPRDELLAKRYYDSLETIHEDLRDPEFGKPKISYKGYSLSTLQSLYYHSINGDRWSHVVEIGGGYGNLYRVFRKMGYEGRYTIVDFPQIHSIQRAFIQNTVDNQDVEFRTLQDFDVSEHALLTASFSINEMPMKDREVIEARYREFERIFIVHNRSFDGIDNLSYFKKLRQRLRDSFQTKSYKCPIHPSGHILIGDKK